MGALGGTTRRSTSRSPCLVSLETGAWNSEGQRSTVGSHAMLGPYQHRFRASGSGFGVLGSAKKAPVRTEGPQKPLDPYFKNRSEQVVVFFRAWRCVVQVR